MLPTEQREMFHLCNLLQARDTYLSYPSDQCGPPNDRWSSPDCASQVFNCVCCDSGRHQVYTIVHSIVRRTALLTSLSAPVKRGWRNSCQNTSQSTGAGTVDVMRREDKPCWWSGVTSAGNSKHD
ncbi:hypothetical protein RRG08_041175 [Elysia crispata]|uniref:Uncharacterized protein n=1 Tax=Elysia crispata TaxID=231223 RepID=A0AAE1CPM6_9GAST|nr:hypothetical protein RRG08_041175 [Elysia crispata]